MVTSCKECTLFNVLQRDVNEQKEEIKKIDTRLQDVEKINSAKEEQMKNFDEKLDGIAVDVKEIKTSKNKFISGIMSGVAITVIAALILQALKVFHW